MTTRITLIAALARNGVIGVGNRMPWHISEDLRRFKALTMGHPVVMGRKTFASIGKALPGRENIVISRSRDLDAPGCRVVNTLEAALAVAGGAAEVFVIGGAEIYGLALPLADRLELTEVDVAIDGDAHFPEWERSAWREVARESRSTEGPEGLRFDFVTYERGT